MLGFDDGTGAGSRNGGGIQPAWGIIPTAKPGFGFRRINEIFLYRQPLRGSPRNYLDEDDLANFTYAGCRTDVVVGAR